MVALVAGPAVPPAAAGADESESTVADSMVPTPGRYAGEAGWAGGEALSTGRGGGAAQAASIAESAAAIEDTVLDVMP